MQAIVDLNSGSGFMDGAPGAMCDVGVRINAHIDATLETAHGTQPPRDYLGGDRIGEPCARRLAYEVTLNRERRDHWGKKGLIEAVWGSAITCHKAQGSHYPTVVVYDDDLGRSAEDRPPLALHGDRRAEWGLVILD